MIVNFKKILNVFVVILIPILFSCSNYGDFYSDKDNNRILINKENLLFSYRTINSFEFQLLSSNHTHGFRVDSLNCEFELFSANSFYTKPYYINLVKIDSLGGGLYVGYIEDLGLSKEYCDDIILRVGFYEDNKYKYIDSKPFHVYYTENTGLPKIFIETPDKQNIVSKDEWIKDATYKIFLSDSLIDAQGKLSIKGRGNTSWYYPKKSYTLKLDNQTSILGMPKHKRWVLLANWMDRTLLRNAVSFEIARKTGLDWTPRGCFVDVVLNGESIGNYFLCEQIRVGENRVNITELQGKDIDDYSIQGGYLLELDVYYDEDYKFKSKVFDLPYMVKSPDINNINVHQISYIYNYVAQMEACLEDRNRLEAHEYLDYIDIESFIDYWIVNELSGNSEILHPKSFYMHKERGDKIKAGPVWDFDWKTFVLWKCGDFSSNSIYFQNLFNDPFFTDKVKQRWQVLKPGFLEIPDFIYKEAERIRISESQNHILWPINLETYQVNEDHDLFFDMAVRKLVEAYMKKLQWMDSKFKN